MSVIYLCETEVPTDGFQSFDPRESHRDNVSSRRIRRDCDSCGLCGYNATPGEEGAPDLPKCLADGP